jgi:hypothetical protein
LQFVNLRADLNSPKSKLRCMLLFPPKREIVMRPNEQLANSIVGFNVATAMASRSIGIDVLARSIGMQPDDLRACLRGQQRLPVDKLCIASEVLCVRVIDLYTMDEFAGGHIIN